MLASREQTEAAAINQIVEEWCKTWKVDKPKLKKTWRISEKTGQLQLELEAPLVTPITSLKTVINILSEGETPENGQTREYPIDS
jgi:phage host-nuclease inhibitor protein Gam